MEDLDPAEVHRAAANLGMLLSALPETDSYSKQALVKLAFNIESYAGKIITHLVEKSLKETRHVNV